MPPEPRDKRAFIFIDGQNLFYSVKQGFGYSYPNYDPQLLAQWVCNQRDWRLAKIHFYTGLPQPKGPRPEPGEQITDSCFSRSTSWPPWLLPPGLVR